MKRLASFALFIVFAFCLTACAVPAKGGGASRENNLNCAFESEVSFVLGKLNADGVLAHDENGAWSVEFSSPNTLSGVKLEFAEGEVNASYKGLSFSVPQSALPVKAMMLNLIQAVADKSTAEKLSGEEKDGMFLVSGTLEGGDYTISADSEGKLKAFEMPNNKLKITLHNS